MGSNGQITGIGHKFSAEAISYLKHESALAIRFEALPMLPQNKNIKNQSIILLENTRKYIQLTWFILYL